MQFVARGILVLAVSALPMQARFHTPVVDGAIQPGEYGNHADGRNWKTAA